MEYTGQKIDVYKLKRFFEESMADASKQKAKAINDNKLMDAIGFMHEENHWLYMLDMFDHPEEFDIWEDDVIVINIDCDSCRHGNLDGDREPCKRCISDAKTYNVKYSCWEGNDEL